MPKIAKELTAFHVKRLTRPGFHAAGGVAGLHLFVKPSGARSWVLRRKIGDRRRDIGLGPYPEVTLEMARDRARTAADQIYKGIDPVEARQAMRTALRDSQAAQRAEQAKRLTFDEAAKRCHAAKSHEFKSARHAHNWIKSLELYASLKIGPMPIDQVELAHVENALQSIWLTKTETARRVRQRMEAVFAWATVSGHRSGDNPARWDGGLEFVLARPTKVRKVVHHPAIPWQDVGAFMADLRQREGMGARALEFAILTAARSGEVRLATWDEIDLKAKLWTVPADRMKGGKAHRVPLSDAAIKLLKALPRFEGSPYVFAAARGGALSDMSLSAVCRRMEVDAVPHGFRSTFKDWARSSTAFSDEVSELALAHVNNDATRAAYARDELLPKRAQMMQAWGKFCGAAKRSSAKVVEIRR